MSGNEARRIAAKIPDSPSDAHIAALRDVEMQRLRENGLTARTGLREDGRTARARLTNWRMLISGVLATTASFATGVTPVEALHWLARLA